MRQLLKHADILYMDKDEWQLIERGYIGIDGARIDYMGETGPDAAYEYELDLARHLLMPGLYNTHTHSPMTLLRGVGSGLPLDRWLHEAIFPIEARLTDEDVRAGTRIALMEFLASGIVSFTDMYDFTRVTAEEVIKSGMKASLNRPIVCFDENEAYSENFRAAESIEFFKDFHKRGDGRIHADFAIHAEYTSKPHIIEAYAQDCYKNGARMHVHLSETQKEHAACKARYGKTPTQLFYDLGVFKSPVTAAHCVMVEDGDIDILAQNGATAVHNPTSNLKLGSGFMPIDRLLRAGVNVGLGTDGAASNNNLNLFEEMHLCALIHKGYAHDPTLISPGDILKMATVNGAKAQGRENAGNLQVGYAADIIAIGLDAPHLTPALDIPALLVYAAQASDVKLTMADGNILYRNGEYSTIDKARAYEDMERARKRLFCA